MSRQPPPRIVAVFALALGIAACGGAGPSATPPVPPPPSAAPTAEAAAPPPTLAEAVQDLASGPTASRGVDRIVQLFEDAMARDANDVRGPTVRPLLDGAIVQVNEACVGGRLSAPAKSKALKLIADARDRRGEGCAVRAIAEYRPDETDADLGRGARAVAAWKSPAAAAPLYAAFEKMHASHPKAQPAFRDVHDAMIALRDPSWKTALVARLAPDVDPHDARALMDEAFWQTTAAELLGLLRANEAVRPLLRVLLSPQKGWAGVTAVLALVRIGKPTVGPATALLRGDDKELVAYARAQAVAEAGAHASPAGVKAAADAYVPPAAIVLGTLGRDECVAPLLAALGSASNDTTRAAIARELPKLPRSPGVLRAFEQAYDRTPVGARMPPGLGAREALIESSGTFFDASLVPFYLASSKAARGDEADVEPVREAALVAMLKLGRSDQAKQLAEMAQLPNRIEGRLGAVGQGFEKEIRVTQELLAECGNDVDCYVKKLGDPRAQERENQFVAIKAAYMAGVLGKPATRDAIVARLPNVTNAAVRFVCATALDALSPRGDVALADRLQAIVDAAEASKDPNRIAMNAPFRTVIVRLRARAE